MFLGALAAFVLFSAMVGAVALLLAARLLPRSGASAGGAARTGHMDLVGVGLLGGDVLATLLPLMEAESGGVARLWWLFPVGALLLVGFVGWERRVMRRGDEPLLDLRLLTETPGFASGAALGMAYFMGFSGIWLVFAIYFQTGLGYTPLQSGLTVTSFALGSAASAVVGGRLVARFGRRLTVLGLSLVATGLAATAVVLLLAPPAAAGPAAAATLLLAGIGGGWVISPNTTMTLRCVPVRHGRLGRRRAADRAADRRRGRHRRPGRAVLRGARRLRRALPGSGGTAQRSRSRQRVPQEAHLQQQQVLGDDLLRASCA